MSVTQKEIADKLNVSQSQVARALNGASGVSEATRRLIEVAAREMGYDATANTAARMLAGKRHGQKTKNGLVAVMFTQIHAATPRNLPFYGPVFDGMEAAAAEYGTEICLCRTPFRTLPRLVREQKVDGVISLGYSSEQVEGIKALNMPVVLFQAFAENVTCAVADDYSGARQATEHLLSLGHRNIAYLGVVDYPGLPGKIRLQGYLDAMRDFGIDVPNEWFEDNLQLPDTTADAYCAGCNECAACIGWSTLKAQNVRAFQDGELPFTAIVCHNDAVAMGVITKAKADGVEVPRDLSIVGFDNISRQYRFSPQITSIDPGLYELGGNSMRLLHKLLQDNENTPDGAMLAGPYEHPVFPMSLAVHESTRPVDGEDLQKVSRPEGQASLRVLESV